MSKEYIDRLWDNLDTNLNECLKLCAETQFALDRVKELFDPAPAPPTVEEADRMAEEYE